MSPHALWVAKHGNTSFYVPHVQEGKVDTSWNGLPWVYGEPGELFVLSVFEKVLKNGSECKRQGLAPPLVLDIGANEGFFGLLAGAWGCTSTMFEPQPGCVDQINNAIGANRLGQWATVVPNPVSDTPIHIDVSTSPICYGGFPFHKYVRRTTKSDGRPPRDLDAYFRPDRIRKVPSVGISTMYGSDFRPHVALIKIDVEGNELSILFDVLNLVRKGQVDNIIVEVTPGWWGKEYNDQNVDRLWQEFTHYGFRSIMQTDMEDKGHRYADLRSMIRSIRSHRRAQGNIWLQRR